MYSSVQIEKPLKEAIAKQMLSLYGFTPELQEIYLTVGGIGALFSGLMSILQKGQRQLF